MKKCLPVAVAVLLGAFGALAWSQTEGSANALEVSFPGKTWAVQIDSPGFTVKRNERKPDGRQYLFAINEQTGLVLSVTLEQSPNGADPKTCSDYLHKRMQSMAPFAPSDVRYSTAGTMPVVEYLVAELEGKPLQQKNFVACTAKEDVYVDIHLSKVQFKPEDETLFTSLLGKVWLTASHSAAPAASSPAEHDTRYYMGLGSRYFLQERYQEAIPPYQKALDLEKQQPTLEKDLWRVLVDNLGMAYGITGDLAKAETTFRYGLSKDPTYPMFSYNMACTYAERNDLDNTLIWLKKAFDNKANSIPGEGMPDPRKDDSFRRFLNEPRFQALVDSLRTK